MIRIALPTGRMGTSIYKKFAQIGYACPEMETDSRKLVFINEARGVSYVMVKPSDVGVYVERGAADIGVVGKDVLLETEPDVYELLDLQKGKCGVCVAAPNDWEDDKSRVLRVATKYPHIASGYFSAQNRDIDIVQLHGSIELAPLLGLTDVIVDIVETGTTLKENDMRVFARIAESSARLIANRSSYQFKKTEILCIVEELEAEL